MGRIFLGMVGYGCVFGFAALRSRLALLGILFIGLMSFAAIMDKYAELHPETEWGQERLASKAKQAEERRLHPPEIHWEENKKIRDCQSNYPVSGWPKCGQLLD